MFNLSILMLIAITPVVSLLAVYLIALMFKKKLGIELLPILDSTD